MSAIYNSDAFSTSDPANSTRYILSIHCKVSVDLLHQGICTATHEVKVFPIKCLVMGVTRYPALSWTVFFSHQNPFCITASTGEKITKITGLSILFLLMSIYLFIWVLTSFSTLYLCTYSWSRLCTVNCRPSPSNYQLSAPGFELKTSVVGSKCATTVAPLCYRCYCCDYHK